MTDTRKEFSVGGKGKWGGLEWLGALKITGSSPGFKRRRERGNWEERTWADPTLSRVVRRGMAWTGPAGHPSVNPTRLYVLADVCVVDEGCGDRTGELVI